MNKIKCNKSNVCANTICEHRFPHNHTYSCGIAKCSHIGTNVSCSDYLKIDRKNKIEKINKKVNW